MQVEVRGSVEIPPPPETAREPVAETLHGRRVEDPYRWLEDATSQRVAGWTDVQNARTRAALDRVPERARFVARLRELLAVGLLETPRPVAGKLFHIRRAGTQKQSVLFVRDTLDGPDRPLIDPNALDREGLVTIDWWYASPDGRYVAYGLSRGGTEMSTLRVREVDSGKDLPDEIPFTQRARVAWVPGGFYYTVHPAPGTVPPGDEHYYQRVRYHQLGADAARDELVFGEGQPKERMLDVATSPNGRWVLLLALDGWVRSDAYLLDREDPDRRLRTIIEGEDALTYGEPGDDRVWLLTNMGAPNCRIVSADPGAPDQWATVVPESEHAIEGFRLTRDRIAVHTLERATARLALWTKDGKRERGVELPQLGSIGGTGNDVGLASDETGDLVTYTFQSFDTPPVSYAVDARTGSQRELVRLPKPAGIPEIAVEQTRYVSRDGTEVTMFLVHRRDIRPTGAVPTLLTGYGGFNISRTPLYAAAAILWAEQGGLYALPNLRGGGEYGERWHRAGMLEQKQNVFDDFHAAAEHLVASGWTKSERLGIQGGSNGGLLVGAALTQRPELYGAVVCAVPLLDMLRYQHLLIARFWIAEYGSSEDAEQLDWLRAYSPYHNVRPGTSYPPVLFTTADGDSRVDPMHARKMTALMQAETEGLVLLRVDRDAGHGIGKPLDKQVDDVADMTAFLAWQVWAGPTGG